MRGQEAVLSALGHRRFYRPTKIQSEGMRNILRAMKACGVPRLICETALGLGNSVFRMGIPGTFFMLPLVLPFYFWDKARQEDLIMASDRDWTIVRPGDSHERRGAREIPAWRPTWEIISGPSRVRERMSLISC